MRRCRLNAWLEPSLIAERTPKEAASNSRKMFIGIWVQPARAQLTYFSSKSISRYCKGGMVECKVKRSTLYWLCSIHREDHGNGLKGISKKKKTTTSSESWFDYVMLLLLYFRWHVTSTYIFYSILLTTAKIGEVWSYTVCLPCQFGYGEINSIPTTKILMCTKTAKLVIDKYKIVTVKIDTFRVTANRNIFNQKY